MAAFNPGTASHPGQLALPGGVHLHGGVGQVEPAQRAERAQLLPAAAVSSAAQPSACRQSERAQSGAARNCNQRSSTQRAAEGRVERLQRRAPQVEGVQLVAAAEGRGRRGSVDRGRSGGGPGPERAGGRTARSWPARQRLQKEEATSSTPLGASRGPPDVEVHEPWGVELEGLQAGAGPQAQALQAAAVQLQARQRGALVHTQRIQSRAGQLWGRGGAFKRRCLRHGRTRVPGMGGALNFPCPHCDRANNL